MAIVEVVKYDGSPDVFAWKFPNTELGTWTQLIVNESQEAVLYKGGQALDWFGAGRHTLETANIPILNKLVNLPFGGRSPFTAEVWYINKVNSLDVKWGTPTPIQLQDPKYNVFVPLRAFGQFGIKISDSKMFLTKLVGTLSAFTSNDIIKYFRGAYLTKVKDDISGYLIRKKISVLEINAYINEISESLKESILPTFADFGIELVNFYVNDISVPEDDSAVIKLKEALAKKAEMDIVGYSYTQERSFDTLEGAATNQGSGSAQFMGAGLGLGMGVGLGGAMGTQFGGLVGQLNTNTTTAAEPKQEEPTIKCSACGSIYSNKTKFCPECGDKYRPCSKCGADLPEGATKCDSCGYEKPTPCSSCGAEISNKGTKFCPECGTSLIKKCPKCDVIIEGKPKFCPECGEKFGGESNE
jgi:membrane protease subunit (stomatin/prohibitin family)